MEKSRGASEKKVRRAGVLSRLCLMPALAGQFLSGPNSEQMAEYHVKAAFLYIFDRWRSRASSQILPVMRELPS